MSRPHCIDTNSIVMHPFDLAQVTLRGEFGRRIERIIEANILKIDIDEVFLKPFRQRGKDGYTGFGKFLDATVRLAHATGDARLRALKTKAIQTLLATQEPDGYIGIIQARESRLKVQWDLHEMSYLMWAFLSDYHYFKERSSLTAAQRLADYILARYAEDPSFQLNILKSALPNVPAERLKGHDTAETGRVGLERGLLALSAATGESKYRQFVIETLKIHEYNHETDAPIRFGSDSLANHAYTRLYYTVAQLDLYRQVGDPKLLNSARKVVDFLRKKDAMLVTGSCSQWEAWHDTQSGQQNTSETCAASYLARLMEAMLQIEGDSLYGDILERDIYNALFSATSPDGSRSRYYTPFDGKRPYDAHAPLYCCANNNKRFLADLRGWMYYRTEAGVAINLYNASTATVPLAPGNVLKLEQQTDYPTSGKVLIQIGLSQAASFEIKLRIPRWCEQATISVNGAEAQSVSGGRFHALTRSWKSGDRIELNMPMAWRLVRGRRSQYGRAAVLRGPVIFTFNPARNPTFSADPSFEPRFLKIDALKFAPPSEDKTVRPDGVCCTVGTWPHALDGGGNPWSYVDGVPMVLSEYPDPGGEGIYFTVPTPQDVQLVDDELI